MAELDYYGVLGVSSNATDDEIKKKYRAIAKRNHPDTNPGNAEADRIFREASEAYEVIGDAEKRRAYDQERARKNMAGGSGSKGNRRKSTGASPGFDFGSGNMASNFEQFFGFHPGGGPIDESKLNPNMKTKANPIDTTELFERYMGIKKPK